ncbi:MAG: hypothetical protein WKG32_04270 [Gemmatimonadaceae bacterium]
MMRGSFRLLARCVAACLATLLVLVAITPAPGRAQRQGPGRANTPPASATAPRAKPDTAVGSARGEDARYYRRAAALRDRLLARASWADFDSAACSAGSLRVYAGDSATAAKEAGQAEMDELERVILVRGVENSLNTPAAHDLLRTVIAWEVGAERPRWDVRGGETPREAMGAGLTGTFLNPATGKCESYVTGDTAFVLLPPLVRFTPPRVRGVALTLEMGEEGLNRMRDAFYARGGANANASLTYVRVRAAVVWREFGVIAVNRPVEANGVVQSSRGAGGAAYIFRRVGTEWRLLAITRSWA